MNEITIKRSEYIQMREQIKEYKRILADKNKKISELSSKYLEIRNQIKKMKNEQPLHVLGDKNLKIGS